MCSSRTSSRRTGFADLPKIIREKNAEGVLFIRYTHPKMIKDIQSLGIPIVAVDNMPRVKGINSTQIDNKHGGGLAADHLFHLGHTQIAFLSPSPAPPSVDERLEGFRLGFERHDRKFSAKLNVIHCEALSFESAYETMRAEWQEPAIDRFVLRERRDGGRRTARRARGRSARARGFERDRLRRHHDEQLRGPAPDNGGRREGARGPARHDAAPRAGRSHGLQAEDRADALAQEKWIEEQRTRLLDVPHFHVVFTLPAELRPLAACAPCTIYDALFRAAASTLKSFARSRLSATLGATLVLHTWTRKLELHPHVHAIVTGGGLSRDGARWCAATQSFLFPVKAMSRVLRGKMMARLRRAYRAGRFKRFSDFRDPQAFARLMRTIAKLPWHVYAKPSFSRSEYVLQYLGRYTHRVGLANSRLLAVTDTSLTFRTKGSGTLTLPPREFLRRFLLHVLPDRFHKIRHIGLYANREKRARVHQLLGTSAPRRAARSWRERLFALTWRDVSRCPCCQALILSIVLPAIRAPPEARR